MMTSQVDHIILGHNPFFGVDHYSQERGDEKAKLFDNEARILSFLKECNELNVHGMMISTHPRAAALVKGILSESSLSSWHLYPLVPNINKYVRGANEKGLVNLAMDILMQTSVGQKFNMLLHGGRGLLGKDFRQAIPLLVDVDLIPFRRSQIGAVFLHDVLTDLALGLGLDSVLEIFRDHVNNYYGVPVGLATKNLPLLRERLQNLGWSDMLIMASFNRTGFAMNPSPDSCAEAVLKPGFNFVAMNTLASGHLRPHEAYSYLAKFRTIQSIVVGVSRKDHAVETIEAIRHHMGWSS